MTTQLGNIFIILYFLLPLWDERHIMLGQVASQTITRWLIKRCHTEKESVCVWGGEHEIGGNSIPSALSKWWMCYDGPAPAHKHVTYSKTKKTSFYCPCLGIFHEHAYNALCLSLFLCFILSLTANDRWRLCRSSKVIEDHGGFFTKEPYLLVFYTFVLHDSLLCQCIFSIYILLWF